MEGKKCHWCGKPTRLCSENDPDQAAIEHIIPKCKGGTNEPENLTSACLLCNARRGYEMQMGLEDGSLLGKYPLTKNQRKQFGKGSSQSSVNQNRIVLTKDEKNKIMGKKSQEDVLREQRDQSLKEIDRLRKELKKSIEIVQAQKEELDSMTIMKVVKKRILRWLTS